MIQLLLVSTFLHVCFIPGVWSLDSYRAAAVQLTDQLPVTTFVDYARRAKFEKAEIVVFPESSLEFYGIESIEKIEVGSIPCENPDQGTIPIQSNMSCAARENEIYVVYNMVERGEPCQNGTEHCSLGFYAYNTNVVMDRTGKVILKYNKINPVVSFYKPGSKNQTYTFQTDFGVEFGIFICYDLVWQIPAQTVVEKYKVNNIVYSSDWIDAIVVQASPVQQGYSEYFQVNLIASNRITTSLGSGIYSKGRVLAYNDSVVQTMMVSDLPLFDYVEPVGPNPSKPIPWNPGDDSKIVEVVPTSSDETVEMSFSLPSHNCTIRYRVKEEDNTRSSAAESFLFGAFDTFLFKKMELCVALNCGVMDKTIEQETRSDIFEKCKKNTSPQTVFEFLEVNYTVADNTSMVFPLVTTPNQAPISEGKQYDRITFTHEPLFHSIQLNQVQDPISQVSHFGDF